MPLQTSGEIKLSQIATEFTDAAPHELSEFYSAATGVPTSGEISISDFYGKGAFQTIEHTPVFQAGGYATYGNPTSSKSPTILEYACRIHGVHGPQEQSSEFTTAYTSSDSSAQYENLIEVPLPDGTNFITFVGEDNTNNQGTAISGQYNFASSSDNLDRLGVRYPLVFLVGGYVGSGDLSSTVKPWISNWTSVYDSWKNLMVNPNSYNFKIRNISGSNGAIEMCWDWELDWDNFYDFYTIMDNSGSTSGTITIGGTSYTRIRSRVDAWRLSQTRNTAAFDEPSRADGPTYKLGMRVFALETNNAFNGFYQAGTASTNIAPYSRDIFTQFTGGTYPFPSSTSVYNYVALFLALCPEGVGTTNATWKSNFDANHVSSTVGFTAQPFSTSYYASNGLQLTNDITMTSGTNFVSAYGFRDTADEGGY